MPLIKRKLNLETEIVIKLKTVKDKFFVKPENSCTSISCIDKIVLNISDINQEVSEGMILPQLISGNIGLEKGETGRGRSAHLASCDLPRVR